MKKIMVVDDEPDIRETVKMVLEKEGYAVTIANNGDDCLRKLETEKPDLILLDIMMPGTPPGEVVKKIPNINVIYLTAVRISEAEKENLLKTSNIIDFIEKPFDIDDLLARVKKGLK